LHYRHVRERRDLAFFAMLGLPILGLAAIVYFSYANGIRVQPAQLLAEQRAEKRALRREGDLECLAENIYFEARGEPLDGQYAVAEVTLNRTRARNFPHSICAVVHETRWDPSRQRYVADFSWTELGALAPQDVQAWKNAMTVATAVYDDLRAPLVPGALFYHATNVRPVWARGRKAITTIGNHIFYQ
jgi:spore germination cell wall hydrolase CwlJ-like protein